MSSAYCLTREEHLSEAYVYQSLSREIWNRHELKGLKRDIDV